MRYKLFGNSGLRVSELCLGAMTFGEEWGWGASKEESRRLFDAIAKLEQANDFADLVAGGVPAKDVLQLAQQVVRARIAQANQDSTGAIQHFAAAVALEDALAYSEPPYWYYPTRQSLGAALLLAGQLDKAEDVLRASLARAPNNGWALFGLMRIYQQRGDEASARAAQQLLDKAWMGELRTLNLARL